MLKTHSIGTKIYSIALSLVLLMIVVSSASVYMVGEVRQELELQSTTFLPLSNHIADIESRVLEGEVVIERLRVAMEDDRLHMTSKESHQIIREASIGIHEEFAGARSILDSLNLDDLSKDAAIATTKVSGSLAGVEQQYRDYEAQINRLLDAHDASDFNSMPLLDQMLTQSEVRIYRELDALRHQMESHVVAAIEKVVELENILNILMIALTTIAALLGLTFAAIVTRRIVTPMKSLVEGLKRVGAGDLETTLAVTTRDETATLAIGFNEMVEGLRAKERITDTFGKYVDSRVVDALISNPSMTKPGGDRRYMTVLFADMRGFTGLSERLSPDALVTLLNVYLEDMSVPIQETDGVIDKFIGDAIMAYWGPPFVDAAHQAQNACTAALRQLNLIAAFQKKVPEILGVRIDGDPIDIHSGIASGPALVGTVGSAHHRNYTIMGDTVNLAARIEGACKTYGVRLLVDEATRKETKGILFREIDALRVKGRSEPVKVFEAMVFDPAPEPKQRLARSFDAGLSAYRRGSFDEAISAFQKCLEIEPQDGPSKVFLNRLDHLKNSPPPSDWDGVFDMLSK
ncbi:MAG: hypothetical protein CMM62_10260 [Rhodospirillaceae bacterium]|nr:hypothetical protein [Rhodospirillaceae bacterium]MAX64541.1 hypothetical protein [Rhodospirillaceae bacterium]MBB58449.1 hypothetical protein [Rhodospirillaceae bacterium]